MRFRVTFLLFIFFLVFSIFSFSCFISKSYALSGINVDVKLFDFLDEYGFPRRNKDGTYYPGDAFKVKFNVTIGRGEDWYVVFDRLEVSYNKGVFEVAGQNKVVNGVWSFEVRKNVTPGTYSITFKAVGRYYYWDCWEVSVVHCKIINDTKICWNETKVECGYVFGGYVSDEEKVTVKIVPYNPEFTVLLSYLVVAKPGNTSYHKPFAVIARYEGSDGNPDRRAIIEGLRWEGFAEKVSPLPDENLQHLTVQVEDMDIVFDVAFWVNRTKLESFGAEKDFLKIVEYKIYDSHKSLKFKWFHVWLKPLYGGDYVKIMVNPEDEVMDKTVEEGFMSVYLNITFQTYRFSVNPKNLFTIYNFTYEPEVFEQPLKFEVYKPKPDGTLTLDKSALLDITFTPFNLSLTTHDIYMKWAKDQTDDQVALRLFEEDIYDEKPQNFKDLGGVLDFVLLKKSPSLFNLTAKIFSKPKIKSLEAVVFPIFHGNKTTYYVNLHGGGIKITKVWETGQYVTLNFTATPKAGGLKNVKVYDEHGNLLYEEEFWKIQRKTYTLPINLRMALEKADFALPRNLKLPAVTTTFLGWNGNKLLYIPKNPETRKYLLVVVKNIWNAKTVKKVKVNPYTPPKHLKMFEQLKWVTIYLSITALTFSFAVWIKRRLGFDV